MKTTSKDFSREEVYQIAKAYSTGTYTYHAFIDEYGCSQDTFYSLINRAVVESIVPDEIAENIEIVSVTNSTNKAKDLSSDPQFARQVAYRGRECNKIRRLKRNSYVLPKSAALNLITEYVNDKNTSKSEFCNKHYMTNKLFDRTIKKAIVQSWIKLDTVAQLREKAYRFNDRTKVDELFDTLLTERKERKMSKSKQ